MIPLPIGDDPKDVVKDGVERDLPLYSEADGSAFPGASVKIQLALKPKNAAFNVVRDVVYEYGRLARGKTTPNGTALKPSDPGRYAEESLTYFSKAFANVAPAVPAGFEIAEDWFVEAGWAYASGFWSMRWADAHFTGAAVARRRWLRTIRRKTHNGDAPPPSVADEGDEAKAVVEGAHSNCGGPVPDDVEFHRLATPPGPPAKPPSTVTSCLCCLTMAGY
mmetsp:Transcript_17524/g.70395  ORF Transcript_17524/g.70395 Transcript_17524/m.70395 type:complete len:221 (-) Transcript_17524:179-841(-)